jgi:hypothetical protein
VGRVDTFKAENEKENLHEINNGNGIRIVNLLRKEMKLSTA